MITRNAAFGLLALLLLAGCQSLSDSGRSLGSGFSGSTDTYGTGRRVDVYGGSTAPVLPTMGQVGYGK